MKTLHRNPNYKECRTDDAVYFVGGPLSQWSRHGFTAELAGQPRTFVSAEQYMMAGKAALFGDTESLVKIVAAKEPGEIKALGREVKGFDKEVWDKANRDLVFDGAKAKFTQNPRLKTYLLETGEKLLVEGAHYDVVWGVGLAFDDPKILDKANWKGENRLGEALMRARSAIAAAEADGEGRSIHQAKEKPPEIPSIPKVLSAPHSPQSSHEQSGK